MDRLEKLLGNCGVILVVLIGVAAFCGTILFACTQQTHAAPPASLVARQFDNQSCTLAAVATHLNYRSGQPDYSAKALALAYTAKYGTSDWWWDGNTSHQAQELTRYAGFSPVYGKLTDAADPVGRMKALAYFGHYPVVFLGGNPEHAIVLIGANLDTITFADPLDGKLKNVNAYNLYAGLDPDKWVFYTE